jgi:S-adenosylmethionine:tRNA ribosyltransferase-isomerase
LNFPDHVKFNPVHLQISEFDFVLPPELVAQEPPITRGASRLLKLDRRIGAIQHGQFGDLAQFLRAGDLLVLNNTRVFPARLLGHRVPSGGAVECLLLDQVADAQWEALMHPGQKLKPGAEVVFERDGVHLHGEVLARHFHGKRTIRLWTGDGQPLAEAIDRVGHMPLPPYIHRDDRTSDLERYQTVYARDRGSVAAPTAGLHFTGALLADLAARGIERAEITLHVGYGTFKPVRVDRVEEHAVDAERYTVPAAAAAALTSARQDGRRIIAVGTTTTRALESLTMEPDGRIAPASGETRLFIHPGHQFRIVDGLVTNFHLPRSSLLMLVAAFAGTDHVLAAYREAVASRYRFYSYGDAMIIL